MAKITLGKRPKNFKSTVTATLLDGTEGKVEMQFTYRTRAEYGAFVDALYKAAGVLPDGQTDEEVKFSLQRALVKLSDTNADYILQIADGWNLDVEFSRDAVVQMCDELPGMALEIINSYRLAVTEGRLGN